MTSKQEGWSNRQKDTSWGYAFAHWIPFVWIYYAITRRTITPALYQLGGAFFIGFSIGLVSAISNPNAEDETIDNLVSTAAVITSPLFVKKGIENARKYGKKKLDNN